MQGIEVFKFQKGEATCEVCGEALPALNFENRAVYNALLL